MNKLSWGTINFCLVLLVCFPQVLYAGGGKVTVHNARFVSSMTYESKNKQHTVLFDSQNEGGDYRLKGKRLFTIIEVNINENGKLKKCPCDNAIFKWRTRHPVDISYKSEYEGFDGLTVDISGTYERQFKKIQCPCSIVK